MQLKADYTKDDDEIFENQSESSSYQPDDTKQVLDYLMEYNHIYHSQYKVKSSTDKREKIIWFYHMLKRVAEVNNGCVTLDIDEDSNQARLIYSGNQIIQTLETNDTTGLILAALLKNYEMITWFAKADVLYITVNESLTDKIMIYDRTEELKILKERMKYPNNNQ